MAGGRCWTIFDASTFPEAVTADWPPLYKEGEGGEGETGGLMDKSSADEKLFSYCHETRVDSMADGFGGESLVVVNLDFFT